MSLSAYPNYKDSGVEWLGEVPGHWEVKRLKQACHVFPSNVDKKSHEGETPVLLCNYTDVYYNETITEHMNFMVATASADQIAKFTLRSGDTIITKDSETADDIAIAAHVP
jgi:type I restriction enzyme S subunit